MQWQWRKLRMPHAGDAIACAELCGPGCSTNRSQLPPLPCCQHLKGIVKILLHSLTVPGRTLPLLVSRLLFLSQVFDDTGIATSRGKKCRIPGSAMIIMTDLSAGINVRADWVPSGLHPSTRQDPCCHMSAYRKKTHYVQSQLGISASTKQAYSLNARKRYKGFTRLSVPLHVTLVLISGFWGIGSTVEIFFPWLCFEDWK